MIKERDGDRAAYQVFVETSFGPHNDLAPYCVKIRDLVEAVQFRSQVRIYVQIDSSSQADIPYIRTRKNTLYGFYRLLC